MFGIFGKPTMTLPERSALLLTLVVAGLMANIRHRQWLSEELRAEVIDRWLASNGKKAGAVYRAKMSSASDEMVRFLVTTQEDTDLREVFEVLDAWQRMKPGESANHDSVGFKMMRECERFLVAKGLHD